jgi:V8-like Glu-specific endopeptidase
LTKQPLFLVLAIAAGCSAGEESWSVGGTSQPIVYGEDDRKDFYQVSDDQLRELARSSSLALIPSEYLHRPNSGAVGIASPTLAMLYRLCPSEPFRTQPAAAICSGVLIDDDLVLTAGHCVGSDSECASYAFVFDYLYHAKGELEDISSSDVYGCRRLIATHSSEEGETDYALVQLDRAPKGRTPVRLRSAALKVGDPLMAIGYPSGLPMKIDRGAEVKQVHGEGLHTFALNSDTFEGSSGSGIFDQKGELAGVLVLGGDDYVKTDAGCKVSKVVAADAGTPEWGWEQATYAASAVKDLCEQGYPSKALCNLEPRCGDGYCSSDPVDDGCAEDCDPGDCAAGACTKGGSTAASPGDPVSAGDGTAKPTSCTVSYGPGLVGSWLWWAGLSACAALAARRARRSGA